MMIWVEDIVLWAVAGTYIISVGFEIFSQLYDRANKRGFYKEYQDDD